MSPAAATAGSERSVALRLEGYSAGYGQKKVVSEVTLELAEGESVALLGPNGAGKTTLINSIVGGTRVFGGKIVVNGEDATHLTPDQFARRGIGIVPQTGGVFPDLTIGENLKLARLASGRDPRGEVEAEVLSTFAILRERRERRAFTLSGGQRQMLAIAVALCCRPTLLLLDEPSIGLAPQAVDALIDAVKWAKDRYGLSVLLAEQHLHAAMALCSRYHLIKSGKIARSGPVDAGLAETLRVEYLM